MPVPQPSCPAFGGPDLDVLYVSSAAIEMTPADFAKAPDGGGLFTLDVAFAACRSIASPDDDCRALQADAVLAGAGS